MKKATNLWQLLMQTADRAPLMIACGVPQSVLDAGSDYDKFHAYAACVPLCQGHPMLASDADLIEKLLGHKMPICPESCAYLWHATAYARSGLGEKPNTPDEIMPSFLLPEQTCVQTVQLGKVLYAAPMAGLLTALTGAKAVSVETELTAFLKPNPYAARQGCAKHDGGEVLTENEHNLCTAQTLRVLGKLCADRGLLLYIHADFSDAAPWCDLLQYLHGCDCLPQTVLVATDESSLQTAAQIVGCVPNDTNTPQIRVGIADQALLELYKTLLPVGVLPPAEA